MLRYELWSGIGIELTQEGGFGTLALAIRAGTALEVQPFPWGCGASGTRYMAAGCPVTYISW